MSRVLGAFVIVSALSALGIQALGQAPPAAAPSAEKVLATKVGTGEKCCFGACAINYRKELGVPLEYLDTLGARIHQARKTPDPVELALAAESLAVAEKVAGKKAAITADDVLKDALRIAKMRNVSAELAAISQIVDEGSLKKELSEMAAAAQEQEQEAKSAAARQDATRELFGTLRVVNLTHECLRIYVDGQCVGVVHEGMVGHFHVHAHGFQNHIEAYCEHGGELVSCAEIFGHHHFFTWRILG
ncbi:MAG: hypothetical protein HY000_07780 [Planctomycetes bacterium]|nr:hypothetical protein [Planctomycetota bacterium]